MPAVSHSTIIVVVEAIFEVYIWLIIARVVLSYVHIRTYHPVLRLIYEVTEPVLGYFRRLLPRTGTFDFSPILAFLLVWVVEQLVIALLTFLFTLAR
jgi:YggT family protein